VTHVFRYLSAEVNAHRGARLRSAGVDPLTKVADWPVDAHRRRGSQIALPGGQQGLGEHLDLSRVTVNRALATLRAGAAIRVRPRVIHVLDPAKLVPFAAPNGRRPRVMPAGARLEPPH